MLEILQLEGLARRPATALSGGQQQRVALARAIALGPKVLLMDKPLSNPDAKLRAELRVELRQITRRLGVTTVYVTHDQTEALVLGDTIAVMHGGRIVQEGDAVDIYRHPTSLYVAEFLGEMNFVQGTVASRSEDGCQVTTPLGIVHARTSEALAPGDAVRLGIKVEDIVLMRATTVNTPPANSLVGTATERSFLGDAFMYHVAAGNTSLRVRTSVHAEVLPGESVQLVLPPARCFAFAAPVHAAAAAPSGEPAAVLASA